MAHSRGVWWPVMMVGATVRFGAGSRRGSIARNVTEMAVSRASIHHTVSGVILHTTTCVSTVRPCIVAKCLRP